jgi:hypothetical protein
MFELNNLGGKPWVEGFSGQRFPMPCWPVGQVFRVRAAIATLLPSGEFPTHGSHAVGTPAHLRAFPRPASLLAVRRFVCSSSIESIQHRQLPPCRGHGGVASGGLLPASRRAAGAGQERCDGNRSPAAGTVTILLNRFRSFKVSSPASTGRSSKGVVCRSCLGGLHVTKRHERSVREWSSRILQDVLGEGYDAHADGTGFFALQSCANHSCEPNAHTLKVSTGPHCGTPSALQSLRRPRCCNAMQHLAGCYLEIPSNQLKISRSAIQRLVWGLDQEFRISTGRPGCHRRRGGDSDSSYPRWRRDHHFLHRHGAAAAGAAGDFWGTCVMTVTKSVCFSAAIRV